MRDDIIMNKVFKQGGQDGKVQSKLSEASGWLHKAEVSSEEQVPRLEVSSNFQSGARSIRLVKHDWQSFCVRDP